MPPRNVGGQRGDAIDAAAEAQRHVTDVLHNITQKQDQKARANYESAKRALARVASNMGWP